MGMTFKGVSASTGFGLGEIFIFEQKEFSINKGNISDTQIESELIKLEKAIDKTLIEIFDLSEDIKKSLSESENLIFDTYRSILEDRYFIREIKDIITLEKVYAKYAIDICIEKYIELIEESDNEYAKQRVHDFNDIKTRLIRNIDNKSEKTPFDFFENHIIVVEELTPSLAGMFCRKKTLGVVAKKGAGYLSHAAIILRSLGIPTLNDIDFKMLKEFNRSLAIIDGDEGLLIVKPIKAEIEKYKDMLKNNSEKQIESHQVVSHPTTTTDGHRIGLHANISNIKEYSLAANNGVDGIGLVRTEMLFYNSKKTPNEKEQVYIYSRIARRMAYKPIIIRTVDIGDDKIPMSVSESDKEAFQNLRGIQRSLVQKEQLKTQIRSIIRASMYGNISISFPMINTSKEVMQVKQLISDINCELRQEGIKLDKSIKMGVIIETKSAVKNLEGIVSEVDFINIGTNDLFQQLMKRDRENTDGKKCEYCEPEFLKIIRKCVNEAEKQNKYVSVCGEMAADPMSSILLLGMGVNDLSISPSKFVSINRALTKVSLKEATDLAQRALKSKTAEDVRKIMWDWAAKSGYDYT